MDAIIYPFLEHQVLPILVCFFLCILVFLLFILLVALPVASMLDMVEFKHRRSYPHPPPIPAKTGNPTSTGGYK